MVQTHNEWAWATQLCLPPGSETGNHIFYFLGVSIQTENDGSVRICTEDKLENYLFLCVVLMASLPSISISIIIGEQLFSPQAWYGICNIPLTGSGKIFIPLNGE